MGKRGPTPLRLVIPRWPEGTIIKHPEEYRWTPELVASYCAAKHLHKARTCWQHRCLREALTRFEGLQKYERHLALNQVP